jgi:hypothetical protein
VEAVDHLLTARQLRPASRRKGGTHVRAVRLHLPALLGRKPLQALLGRFLVFARRHRQHPRMLGIGQVGQHRGVQFVPLFEADLIQAHIRDPSLRVDRLLVLELMPHDRAHHLGADPQPPGDFFFGRTDQPPQHLLLEAIGAGHVLALEGRQQPLAMVAAPAAMERRLVHKETGLAP